MKEKDTDQNNNLTRRESVEVFQKLIDTQEQMLVYSAELLEIDRRKGKDLGQLSHWGWLKEFSDKDMSLFRREIGDILIKVIREDENLEKLENELHAWHETSIVLSDPECRKVLLDLPSTEKQKIA